ncbi:hypothetical protein NCCP133_12730 [Cytobacillus sp. NCCP-133]|nr:hypothetical protein NCCP133_12730 [Cytobacillus sp. NCCP-133]
MGIGVFGFDSVKWNLIGRVKLSKNGESDKPLESLTLIRMT